MMIPFEFIVEAPPVSLQTRNRTRLQEWQARVRSAAELYWPAGDSVYDMQCSKSAGVKFAPF